MFRTILVPTDGSPLSARAVNAAVEFAKEYGARINRLSVAEPSLFMPLSASAFSDACSKLESRARDVAREHVRRVAAASHVHGVPCETVVTQSFSPAGEIVSVALRGWTGESVNRKRNAQGTVRCGHACEGVSLVNHVALKGGE